jgi:hypothetical protein
MPNGPDDNDTIEHIHLLRLINASPNYQPNSNVINAYDIHTCMRVERKYVPGTNGRKIAAIMGITWFWVS